MLYFELKFSIAFYVYVERTLLILMSIGGIVFFLQEYQKILAEYRLLSQIITNVQVSK